MPAGHEHPHAHDDSHPGAPHGTMPAHDHHHDHHAHGHAHDHTAGASERALRIALVLTGVVLVIELAGGILTGSLALISDAAHMFTDTAALAIALAAIRVGRRAADTRRTYGYHRFEILAAAVNALLLFVVAAYILFEAWHRLGAPRDIASMPMLVIAAIGAAANLLSMRVLAGGKDHSLNVKGAYLEVWSDLLGSVGVIIGALVIHFTGWMWVDSVVAVLIGLWVLPRTWVLLKASVNILLEGVPDDIDIGAVRHALLEVPGVVGIHDLHIWALTSGKSSLTVHVVCAPDADAQRDVLPAIQRRLAQRFGITHATVQCELAPCYQAGDEHRFASASTVLGADHADAKH